MGRPKKGPLTLEKYHRFFLDPWSTGFTNEQLNSVRIVRAPTLSFMFVPVSWITLSNRIESRLGDRSSFPVFYFTESVRLSFFVQ
jgi:hypothetical protein